MNPMYIDPKLPTFSDWMKKLKQFKEGEIDEISLMDDITKIQSAYRDLHFACHSVNSKYMEAYSKKPKQ